MLHSNGLSPVCNLTCSVRVVFCLNSFPQCSHLKGFSPEWIRACLVRLFCVLNSLSHVKHKNLFVRFIRPDFPLLHVLSRFPVQHQKEPMLFVLCAAHKSLAMYESQMYLQLSCPSKSCATLHAYVGLVTTVFSLVYGQSPTASEALATLSALEPRLARVASHVVAQRFFPHVRFSTRGALVIGCGSRMRGGHVLR